VKQKKVKDLIESPLQAFIVHYLKGIGVSQRKFSADTGVSETTFGTYVRMTSAMGIDLLDKILSIYPDMKGVLIEYLSRNTDEKSTSVANGHRFTALDKEIALRKKREEEIKILEDYIEKVDKQLEELLLRGKK
jgi:transcriptional regulator with XRE-family HTH domain